MCTFLSILADNHSLENLIFFSWIYNSSTLHLNISCYCSMCSITSTTLSIMLLFFFYSSWACFWYLCSLHFVICSLLIGTLFFLVHDNYIWSSNFDGVRQESVFSTDLFNLYSVIIEKLWEDLLGFIIGR